LDDEAKSLEAASIIYCFFGRRMLLLCHRKHQCPLDLLISSFRFSFLVLESLVPGALLCSVFSTLETRS
jgi:hypothetical protein